MLKKVRCYRFARHAWLGSGNVDAIIVPPSFALRHRCSRNPLRCVGDVEMTASKFWWAGRQILALTWKYRWIMVVTELGTVQIYSWVVRFVGWRSGL